MAQSVRAALGFLVSGFQTSSFKHRRTLHSEIELVCKKCQIELPLSLPDSYDLVKKCEVMTCLFGWIYSMVTSTIT